MKTLLILGLICSGCGAMKTVAPVVQHVTIVHARPHCAASSCIPGRERR